MGISTRVTCDYPGCKEERKETNHWFLVRRQLPGFVIPYPIAINISPFSIGAFTKGDICLCGETHLSQWVAQNAASLHVKNK
jgi:hypothetical protein